MYSGEPTDIWAAGVLLYVLLFSEFPFSGDSLINLAANIKNGDVCIKIIIIYIYLRNKKTNMYNLASSCLSNI